MRILLVEDDDAIAVPLTDGLTRAGHIVDRAATGHDALAATGNDVVLLDLGLPDLDGVAVCRELRARSDIPIIVVSARGDELDRVLLLEMGADDYVVKPFGLRELRARIDAVTRRTQRRESPESRATAVTVGPLEVDTRTRRATVDGKEVTLAPREFDLLAHLASDVGAVHTREDILHRVWDENWWGSTRTLDVHVAALRKKLGLPDIIETVRGVGFRIVAP